MWPSVEFDLEIIKTSIMSVIYDDYLKKVTPSVLKTLFSLIWLSDYFLTHSDPVSNVT